jgi:pyrroloquinoline-quinone synthase
MSSQGISWIDQLDQLIQQKHMLSHPFYKAWTCGELTHTQLKEYAKEYYHHVKAFPTYLSALHCRCEEPEIRRSILNNLIDEEAGRPNHPDLWKSFILALGVSQEEIDSHKPGIQTKNLINTFKESCSLFPLAIGIAALYCYESQIPAICKTKIDGLKKWYGIENPEEYRYFSVHETADVEHSLAEKDILRALVSPGEEEAVLKRVEKTLTSLEDFLSSFL